MDNSDINTDKQQLSNKDAFDIDAGKQDWNEENNFDIKEDWHQLNNMDHLNYVKKVVVEVCKVEVPEVEVTSDGPGELTDSSEDEEERRDLEKLKGERSLIAVFDYNSRHGGMNAPMISALSNFQGWQEIEITVDSGACDTVMPLSLCAEMPLQESDQQRSGLEYEVANGASIRNEGERR